MNKRTSKARWGSVQAFPTVVALRGQIDYQTVSRPTMVLMSKEEAEAFNIPGLEIAYSYSISTYGEIIKLIKDLISMFRKKALNIALDSFVPYLTIGLDPMNLGISLSFSRRHSISYNLAMKRSEKGKLSLEDFLQQISARVEMDNNGKPVVVIVARKDEDPFFSMRFEIEDETNDSGNGNDLPNSEKKPKPKKYTFLKEPLKDDMLIEALIVVDKEMTGGCHVGRVKWKEGDRYHERPYHDDHLLLCLFFYVQMMKLNDKGDFVGRIKNFYDFCKEGTEGKLEFTDYPNIGKYYKKLQSRKESFISYLKAKEKFIPKYEKATANLLMWHELYCQAQIYFDHLFFPNPIE